VLDPTESDTDDEPISGDATLAIASTYITLLYVRGRPFSSASPACSAHTTAIENESKMSDTPNLNTCWKSDHGDAKVKPRKHEQNTPPRALSHVK
jgi:hypothetical protein